MARWACPHVDLPLGGRGQTWIGLSMCGVLPIAPWRRRDLCGGRGFSQVGPQSSGFWGIILLYPTSRPCPLISLQLIAVPGAGQEREHEQDLSLGPSVLRLRQGCGNDRQWIKGCRLQRCGVGKKGRWVSGRWDRCSEQQAQGSQDRHSGIAEEPCEHGGSKESRRHREHTV